jgi:putative DNA primase/helicase
MSSFFEQLTADIFIFGDNSIYKGDKNNYRIKNKDQFIRRFLRDNPTYRSETHVTLRQVVTHIRTNIWNNLSDMDRYGIIREPVWDAVTNEEDICKTLDLLTEEDVQTHTFPEELEEFLSYFPADFNPYLFPLEPNSKDPLEDYSWKPGISKRTGKPYFGTRVSRKDAIKLLKDGYNVGIAGTDSDPLSIMDKDDVAAVGISKFTLADKSRKQIGEHHFYFTDDPAIKGKISTAHSAKENINTGNFGEIRAVWEYVVACGSYVPCTETDILAMPEEDRPYAGYYRLYQRAPIATITYDEFPEVYKKQVEKTRVVEVEKERQWSENQKREKPVYSGKGSAMWDLSLYDVTGLRDNPGVHFPIPSEFGHGSDTGKNCCVSNGLLTCWRHNVKHNGLTALAVYAGVAECEDGIPFHAHHTGINFKDPKVQFKIWEYAFRHGLLPKGDKIPSKALRYYAESMGIAGRATA